MNKSGKFYVLNVVQLVWFFLLTKLFAGLLFRKLLKMGGSFFY
jgi:hypothetical protein